MARAAARSDLGAAWIVPRLGMAALACALAGAAAAQEPCPYGGAVAKVQKLPQEIGFANFTETDVFGRVEGFPDCEVTVEEVRQAASLEGCALYADRPDALGMEMVFSCLLEKTAGDPPAGTLVYVSAIAAQRLLGNE
ncbi:MAG TPA: hypothetical protein VFR34_10160 [Paracoccaceae bacterium]|nr:hypothetical protein [Paracoccaceae bacterium]